MTGRRASEDRRDAILNAALEAYRELGWNATTIAHIRERSGASIGSIYHHFKDKEGIAAALYADGLRHYHEALSAIVNRSRTARSLVRGIVLHHVDWSVEHETWARYLVEMRSADAVQRAEEMLRASTASAMRDVLAHLRPYVERGEIVRLPSVAFVAVLIGPAQHVVRHWLSGAQRTHPRELRKALADAAWRALDASTPSTESD